MGFVGSSTLRAITFLPVGDAVRRGSFFASAARFASIVATSTRVTSERRGSDGIRLVGSVRGSSCGKIKFSIAARTAMALGGSTNTNVASHRATWAAFEKPDPAI